MALAIVAIAAIGVGVLTVIQPGAAAAAAAALLLCGVMVSTPRAVGPVLLSGRRFGWLSFAWAYVMIRPIGHFTAGRTTLSAVGGAPSVENLIDLSIHGTIALAVLWSLRTSRFRLRPSPLMFALPVLALASAAWSQAVTVTLGFAYELIVIWLLAVLTSVVYRADRGLGQSVLRRTLRVIVQGVALLCVVGLVLPHRGGLAAGVQPGDTRFTWPGEHPLVATAETGLALLVMVFAGRDIGFSRYSRIALVILFGVCLFLGQSRTPYAGLVAAGLFGYWFRSRERGWARRLAGVGGIAIVAVLIASSFGGPITQYLYRGESQQQVFGLNGRLGLWSVALGELHTPAQSIFGRGLGASRVFLAASVSWAGDAHSAWLELMLSLGLIGIAAAITLVCVLAARLFRSAPEEPLASVVIPILFVYVLAMSPAATGFAAPGPEPGLGFALLGFCYGATARRQPALARARAPDGVRVRNELQPAT